MGLDIRAASKIELIHDAPADQEAFHVGRNDDEFADRADGLTPGLYRCQAELSFRAGSYSGYNAWRESLAELAGYPKRMHRSDYKPPEELHAAGAWEATEGPFWELINFSDCEGTIGPKTSAKLAKDFADHQAKADAHPDEWFRDRYAMWRRAFEMASDDGAVGFH
jgi:hypothetical protein